jgi:hypothetical protein
MSARSRLRAARHVESAPSPMKKDPDQNSTDSAEIEALITRIEWGQLRDGDAQYLAPERKENPTPHLRVPSARFRSILIIRLAISRFSTPGGLSAD